MSSQRSVESHSNRAKPGATGYGNYINGATSSGMNPNSGGTSLSNGQVTSAAAAILMAAPVDPDENGNCPDGYKKNLATGKCDPICTGGKYYNTSKKICECPEGMVEDATGKCVIDPCNQIKRLVQNDSLGSNILPIVNQLRNKLGTDNNEWSIGYKNKWINGTRKNVPNDNGIQEGISKERSLFKYGNTWVGQIHTHPQGTYSIFSWLDIRAIKILHTDSHNHFNDEVFLMAVASNNITYTLKVNNIQTLIVKIDADMQNAKGSNDREKREYLMLEMAEKYEKSTNLEQTFLSLFGNYGVSLYKATDTNLNNWKQLELDENNNEIVTKTPCN